MNAARQAGESALQISNHVRQGSVDPMGVPMMNNALEDIDKVNASLRNYIENLNTYIATIQ